MFPLSALLAHAELKKRKPTATSVGEARRATRRMRYGNLTLFPRVEHAELVDAKQSAVEQPRVFASISNVSTTGVGLILTDELPTGLEFDVEWEHGDALMPLRFEVVHSRPVSAGMYRTGARLIDGVLPEEPLPREVASTDIPADQDARAVDEESMIDVAPVASSEVTGGDAGTSMGVLKYEPAACEPQPHPTIPAPPGTFRASSAFGFDKTEKLDGVTTCGWERQIALRREGDRLWIYIHSPGKKNGWGIYVNPDQFESALARVQQAARSPFISTLAA
jgi:hypothetical protein